MKKRIFAAVLLAGAMRVVAQPEQPICDDNGDCYNRRSATMQIRRELMPRLLQK